MNEVRRFLLLLRHLVGRITGGDWLAHEERSHSTLLVGMAILAVSGGYVAWRLLFVYLMATVTHVDASSFWRHQTFFLTLSMTIGAVLSILAWDLMVLDRRDFNNLLHLPLRIRTLFAAKFAANMVMVLAMSLAFNALALFVFVFFTGDVMRVPAIHFGFCHLLSTFLGNAFVFLTLSALQLLLLTLLPERLHQRLAPILQSLLLIGAVSVFIWFPAFYARLPELKSSGSAFVYAFPPVWFTGVMHEMIGLGEPVFAFGLNMVILSLTVLAGLHYLAAPLLLRRFLGNGRGEARRRAGGIGRRRLAEIASRLFVTPAEERGFYAFYRRTLQMSRRHRLHLAAWMAVPLGYLVTSGLYIWLDKGWRHFRRPLPFLITLPLVLLLFRLVGLRQTLLLPMQPEAAWIFRLYEAADPGTALRAAKKLILLEYIVPPLLLFLPLYGFLWGVLPALTLALYCLMLALILLELLLAGCNKVPLVSLTLPGGLNLKTRWPFYILGFSAYVGLGGALGRFLLDRPLLLPPLAGATVLFVLAMEKWQTHRLQRDGLIYEEEEEPVMATIS